MNKFYSTPLKGVAEERFQILIGYVGSLEWWHNVFDAGACIAGGAAMFVADDVQCICDVGDIDIWMPRTVDMTPHVESLCIWLHDHGMDHRIRVQNHIVTVFNPIMNIQFISAAFETDIAMLLDGFDYDCVQCAIYFHVDRLLRNGKEITSLHLLLSKFAIEAHKSRQINWINLRRWKFSKFASMQNSLSKERVKQRDEKMRRKHFYQSGTTNIKVKTHVCLRSDRIPTDGYWNMIESTNNERFPDCHEQIASICQKKRDQNYVNQCVQGYRADGHNNDDEVGKYIIEMLESLKLDEETFKTAKIELTKTSKNEWVLAPTVQDTQRLELEKEIQKWTRFSSMTETLERQYALRNLKLLADPSQPLETVRDSILSDALKCCNANNRDMVSFGLSMDFQMHDPTTVKGLLDLIQRTFL